MIEWNDESLNELRNEFKFFSSQRSVPNSAKSEVKTERKTSELASTNSSAKVHYMRSHFFKYINFDP